MTAQPATGTRPPATEPWREDLTGLVDALDTELRDAVAVGAPVGDAVAALADLRRRLPDTGFAIAHDAYEALCAHKAAALNAVAEVASSHPSMEDFWRDAERQETGASRRGYWDTYEHGRRRQLEALVARAHGAPGAVLLNTGMSAIDVALGAAGLRPGDRVAVHRRAYFETTEYLDAVLHPRGVEIVRCDLTDPVAVRRQAADPRVRAVLAETALNSVPCAVPAGLEAVTAAGILLIIDNSALSHAVPLFALYPGRLLVVESAIKYLTGSCTAGVVYGRGADLDAARDHARRVGQQLQERAFNHLQVGELTGAARRVHRHGAGARAFRAVLDGGPWAWIHQVTDTLDGRDDPLAGAVREAGPGSLLFARLPGDDTATAAAHRAVINRWVGLAAGEGVPVAVRAGFGWTRTSVRSYESTRLNQPDAPTFLRVSVGLEPVAVVRRLAELLDRAAREVTGA